MGVTHDKFQLYIANGCGTITRKPSGGAPPRPARVNYHQAMYQRTVPNTLSPIVNEIKSTSHLVLLAIVSHPIPQRDDANTERIDRPASSYLNTLDAEKHL